MLGRGNPPARSAMRGKPRGRIAMWLAIVIALVAPVVVDAGGAGAQASCSVRVLNIVAHHDDDLLFINPDVARDIRNLRCVRTLVVTASDVGLGAPRARSRENGLKAAYARMAGVADAWSAGTAPVGFEVVRLDANPRVELMFMHVPDGGSAGTGYPVYGNASLEKLWDGRSATLPNVLNPSIVYTRSSFITAMASVINAYAPNLIRTQQRTVHVGVDHSDHLTVTKFVDAARASVTVPHAIWYYVDYALWYEQSTLTPGQTLEKGGTFLAYAPFDPDVCQTLAACGPTGYADWFSRRSVQASSIGANVGTPVEFEDGPHNLTFTAWPGTTGRGLLGWWTGTGQYAQVTIDVPQAGTYTLAVRYANGDAAEVPRQLTIGGVVQGTMTFPTTGTWSELGYAQRDVTLAAGINVVRLTKTDSARSGINVDHLLVEPSPALGAPPPPPPASTSTSTTAPSTTTTTTTLPPGGSVTLEAEDAAHNLTFVAGFGATGRGLLGYWGSFGQGVTFSPNRPAGRYRLRFRVGTPDPATRALLVNGATVTNLAMPNTGGWAAWAYATTEVDLPANATVGLRLQSGTTGGLNLDHLIMEPVAPTGTTTTTTSPATTTTTLATATTTTTLPTATTTTTTLPTATTTTTVPPGGATTFEAEDATHNMTFVPGFGATGRGLLGFWGSVGQLATFGPNQPAGRYRLRFRVATPDAATRSVLVNGAFATRLSMPNTGGWATWGSASTDLDLPANATVGLSLTGADIGGLNLDHLILEPLGPTTTTTTTAPATTTTAPATTTTTTAPATTTTTTAPATTTTTTLPPGASTTFEAEDGVHNLTFVPGFGSTGRGLLGYWGVAGRGVTLSPNQPAGRYRLSFRVATPELATRSVLINGAFATRLTMPNTFGWGTWSMVTTELDLPASATVGLWFVSGDVGGVNVDHLVMQRIG